MKCVLKNFKTVPLTLHPNYRELPITLIDTTSEGADRFNELYAWVRAYKGITLLTRTKSGGISTSVENFLPPMYDVRVDNSVIELTIIVSKGMCRVQFRSDYLKSETTMSGRTAFIMFARKAKELSGIDMQSYWKPGCIERRDEVPRYIIDCDTTAIDEGAPMEEALVFKRVHHIDFRSSFGAGLANAYPELRPTVEWFFKRRDENPRYKGVINSVIGVMWSPMYQGAGFLELAKAAISDNNRRVEEMTARLVRAGRLPILRNTDGIWYSGELYPPDDMYGDGLGQWHHDHVNCKLRVKSRGAYEYIENGVYHPVLRGRTNLDSIKSRDQWQWGDIYNKSAEKMLKFGWDDEKGIIKL